MGHGVVPYTENKPRDLWRAPSELDEQVISSSWWQKTHCWPYAWWWCQRVPWWHKVSGALAERNREKRAGISRICLLSSLQCIIGKDKQDGEQRVNHKTNVFFHGFQDKTVCAEIVINKLASHNNLPRCRHSVFGIQICHHWKKDGADTTIGCSRPAVWNTGCLICWGKVLPVQQIVGCVYGLGCIVPFEYDATIEFACSQNRIRIGPPHYS